MLQDRLSDLRLREAMNTQGNSGRVRLLLDSEHYEAWKKRNMELFDQLPENVRYALNETGVEADCAKLLAALKNDVPEEMVIEAIESQARINRADAARQSGLNRKDRRALRLH